MTDAESLVQRQLDAYNARDLGRFAACHADDVRLYRMPSAEPTLSGRAALEAFYANERFNRPGLRAELVHRIALGGQVIDHERVHGVRETPFDAVVAYEVAGGLIRRVWMFAG